MGSDYDGEVIDLFALLSYVLQFWVVTASTFLLVLMLGVAVILNLPSKYKSEVVLVPTVQGDSLKGLAGQYSGLASLAGINLSSGGVSKSDLVLEVLQSRTFLMSFIEENNILHEVYASKGWNPITGELKYDNSLYNIELEEWVREASLPRTVKPSLIEVYQVFESMLEVSTDRNTGVITVSLEFFSPEKAKYWLDLLILKLNRDIKSKDIKDARASIKYLEQQIQSTSLSSMKMVFYKLIEEQTKTILFASVREDYALETIDPAYIPLEQSGPSNLILIFLVGVLSCIAGVVTSIVYGVLRNYLKNRGSKA
ncbi:Wzz/FepE/Etk N-terminal domain-containing protein [Saccharophagus degradans]|uniref:Wzz/FepE/Etk N-terminal domain-containing protein n=1 Tax=Saccharophagus degradans TaxID=86304 RepID=A0AAW7X2G4_9GAMM|nr:Wzz/FepE/Etk N-terminal domain-containing protein [Saccharophagus degradans]MDO6421057.1 Wzz/FepE/Etk N-terminal domain-containing protein [Saccharophagus degradans]MDO6606032.1 Wzz/FepE/Etk N-terminal domain-containing protein [Saccharophagus degradans]